MEQRSTGSTELRIAQGLLAALFVMTAIRAALIPVTPPEAAMYNQFVGPSLQDALAANWANAPVLYVLLARVSTSAFHLTDLSLRLPGLVAAALYFLVIYRLAKRLFGRGWAVLAPVACLAPFPLILDDLAMATGLGLALAFWLCSSLFVLEDRLNWAGVCAGLSLSANFSFILPALLLALIVPRRRVLQEFGLRLLVTAFLVLVIPLNHATFKPIRLSRLEQPALFLIPAVILGVPYLVRRKPIYWGVILVAVGYLVALQPYHFRQWPEYAGARSAIKAIRQDAGPKALRLTASPGLDQVLHYYRSRYALGTWSQPPTPPFDYYLLNHQDEHLILERHLHTIWHDAYLTVAR